MSRHMLGRHRGHTTSFPPRTFGPTTTRSSTSLLDLSSWGPANADGWKWDFRWALEVPQKDMSHVLKTWVDEG